MVANTGTEAYPRRRAFALGLARVGGSALFATVFSEYYSFSDWKRILPTTSTTISRRFTLLVKAENNLLQS